MKQIVLTGDRPTGKLHLGHYVGSLISRLELQKEYHQFLMIADLQALTDNANNTDLIKQNIIEVAKDYLAVGIDINATNIFLQSLIPELTEITFYYLNLVNLGRLERNPTVKNEIQQKNFGAEIPVGFLCYPISQAADITAFKAEIIPVGDDQIPVIEQTNEIVRKFNRIYNSSVLKEAKALISKTSRLTGIDGKAKMSKSLNNAIFLSEDSKSLKDKIFSMFTDPDHIKISDPGKVDGNVVFTYLDAFYTDIAHIEELKSHYTRGGLGDVTIKNLLNDVLQELLNPIRDARAKIDDKFIVTLLAEGSKKARITAKATLEEIKDAMGISNFLKIS